VVLFLSRQADDRGSRFGRILIGIGLMLLALRLVGDSTAIMTKFAGGQGAARVPHQRLVAGDQPSAR